MKSLKLIFVLSSLIAGIAGISFALEIGNMITPDELQKLKSIGTIRAMARIDMAGLTGHSEFIYAAPGMMHTEIDLGILKMTQGFDGETAWIRDQNGQYMELTGGDRKNIISGVYMTGMCYFLDNCLSGQVQYAGDTTMEEISYHVFSAVPDFGDSLWLYFNTASRRLEIVEERLDEISIMNYLSDFRMIDGMEIPFVSKSKSSVPQLNMTAVTDTIEFNVPVDFSLFEMIPEGADNFVFPVDRDSVVVPFVYHNGHIFLKASINGLPPEFFILDSGAGTNVVDREYAEKIGLKPEGDLPAKGIAGYGSASLTRIDSLAVGGVMIYDEVVGVIDFSAMALDAPGEIGGVLGHDLLSRFPIKINYADSVMVLYNPETFVPPDSSLGIDFEYIMKIPLVNARYGDVDGKFLIDLGNPFSLILHHSFVEDNDLAKTFTNIDTMQGNLGGVGGLSDVYAATGDDFQIGAVRISKPPLLIAQSETGVIGSLRVNGNMGNLLLQEFELLLDYKGKKIYIMALNK
nr:aspartyl protease family protein [candidate division Zixibacteria bacterium]